MASGRSSTMSISTSGYSSKVLSRSRIRSTSSKSTGFTVSGSTPEWIYGVMSQLGMGNHRVSRFRGKQDSFMDRLGESLFLVAQAHRLVANSRLCTGKLRSDLPEPEGTPAEWMCRSRGCTSAPRGLEGCPTNDPASRDRPAVGRTCLRTRRALPWPACCPCS